MAVFPDDDLPYHSIVVAQRNQGFMDQGVGEFSFGMRDMDALPRRHLIDLVD